MAQAAATVWSRGGLSGGATAFVQASLASADRLIPQYTKGLFHGKLQMSRLRCTGSADTASRQGLD